MSYLKTPKSLFIFIIAIVLCSSCSTEDTTVEAEALPEIIQEELGIDPITIMYVEVNSDNILNVGAYTRSNGKSFFDVAMIFAANINYDEENDKPIVFLNSNTEDVLENQDNTIRPLQDKGIKVLLSILGNRQRYGFANFPDRETAAIFAEDVAQVINKYGLDGVDLDDEFVNYGQDGTPASNSESFIFLLEELRKVMPNKLITFYNIGESAKYTSSNGVDAGSILDYSWQPFYGVFNGTIVPNGLMKENYSASAININANPLPIALNFARRTKEGGFGAYMMYNLTDQDYTEYLNSISEMLFNETTTRTEELKQKGEF